MLICWSHHREQEQVHQNVSQQPVLPQQSYSNASFYLQLGVSLEMTSVADSICLISILSSIFSPFSAHMELIV